MEFRLLGSLEVADNGRVIRLGGPKQRAVLAHLLLRANQTVSTDRLIDEVWGEEPPNSARSTLHGYVSHLRKALGGGRLEGHSGGYTLHTNASEVDVLRFEVLVKKARKLAGADPAAAVRVFDDALSLWRGPALDDLTDHESLRPDIARLEELRIAATEERMAADLDLGRHAELIPELETLAGRYPLRERLWGHLMVALYRSGRQGKALAVFARAREIIAEELGIDPSPELQRLQEQILKQDPALDAVGEPLRGYRLLEQLGEGAFGTVFRATQPQVAREVAVKIIHPRLANNVDFIRRFEAEAQLVARLEHPHVVPLYDYWRDPEGAYLVMRFLRGGNLRDATARGALELETAIGVIDHIAAALAAAHRQGVVHRDVKPANILFDEDNNAYLADFGIAKDLAAADWPAGGGSQSPFAYYLSPEEIRGEPPTARTDIYSLGLVLYEMLSGRHPYADSPPEQVLQMHLRAPVPSLRSTRDDVSRAVDAVIERATAKDPEERYPDVLAVASALRTALAPAPAARSEPLAALELRNPYKGLRPFLEADADDFFGRSELVERLVARMASDGAASRLLAVVGPSGSGKSSVVRAGLVPALRRDALPGSQKWFVVEMVPGGHPFAELEAALLRIAANPLPRNLVDETEHDEEWLLRTAERVLADNDAELLLVIDQFEELFTLVEDEELRAQFLATLVAAVTDPRSRLRIVIALRADFFDRPLLYTGFGDLLAARTEPIAPLSAEELARAIAGPAVHVGATVEPALEAEVVAEVAGQPGALPLFQYALTELFEGREDGALTLQAYRAVGGVSGALARRAEEIYEGLDRAGEEAATQLFLRLVTLGEEGSEHTRRRVLKSELTSLEVGRGAMDRVVDAFGTHRLLSFDRDPVTRGPTVEVAHEALLREWGRLRDWIEGAREDLRMHRRLASATREWEEAGRDHSFLLRGSRLDEFETWGATSRLALTGGEREFLQTSLGQRDTENAVEEFRQEREGTLERRSIRRLRALVAILAAASLVAAGLSGLALNQRGTAREQARIAFARELAAAGVATLNADPERSILLAMEAVRAYRAAGREVGRDAVEALHRGIQASRAVMRLVHPSTANVAYSPDGRWIATGGSSLGTEQRVAVLWNATSGQRVRVLRGHTGDLNDLVFSRDGSRLATAAGSETIVWDVRTGERLLTLPGASAFGVAFSPDGSRVATADLDGTLTIWDATSGKDVLTKNAGVGLCSNLSFSPDGTRIAVPTCFGNGVAAFVWDAGTGRELLTIEGPDGIGLGYSPDGRRLITAGTDGKGRIWDARTGRLLLSLEGHTGIIFGATYSPDGRLVATSSGDGTSRLWDAETGRPILTLAGHASSVVELEFSPDGRLAVTGGADGTARVWDVSPEGGRDALTLVGNEGEFPTASYSPDGKLILTGSDDGARLWDASSGPEVWRLPTKVRSWAEFSPDGARVVTAPFPSKSSRLSGPVIWDIATGERIRSLARDDTDAPGLWSATFSPDGKLVASANEDGTATVWDAGSGRLNRILRHSDLPPPQGPVTRVDFSPDGSLLATSSMDTTVKVWDVSTGRRVLTLTPHASMPVWSVAFGPDGRRLVTGGDDGTARIWDVRSGRELATLSGHTGRVFSASLSPDARLVATGSEDTTVRLWDASTGREILKLAGHAFGVSSVGFSPDGRRLVSSSFDGTVRVYVLGVGDLMDLASQRVSRTLTDEECRLYLHVDRCEP